MNNDLISRSALLDKLQPFKEGLTIIFEGLENGIEKRLCSAEICGILEAIIQVHNAPAVDAVEVVRCKDCVFYDFGECANYKMDMTDGAHFYPYPDDFCSYGERRADDGK